LTTLKVFITVDVVRFRRSLYTIIKKAQIAHRRPIFLVVAFFMSGSDPFCHKSKIEVADNYKRILTDVPHARRCVRIVHYKMVKRLNTLRCLDFTTHFRYLEEDMSNPRSKLGARIRMCGTANELSFLIQTTLFLRLLRINMLRNSNQDLKTLYYQFYYNHGEEEDNNAKFEGKENILKQIIKNK